MGRGAQWSEILCLFPLWLWADPSPKGSPHGTTPPTPILGLLEDGATVVSSAGTVAAQC